MTVQKHISSYLPNRVVRLASISLTLSVRNSGAHRQRQLPVATPGVLSLQSSPKPNKSCSGIIERIAMELWDK